MKKLISLFIATACGIFILSGCSKEVVGETENESERTAQLRIITRSGDVPAVKYGQIYIFNDEGTCIDVLTTDQTTQSASSLYAPGTYQVYAVGSEDLSRFSLPTKDNASPESEIQLNTGSVMEDFLTAHTQVTLVDNVSQQLYINMERKVINFNNITIKKVPTDVTGVSITIEPLYKKILLNGTFPDATEAYTKALIKQEDGTTWQILPDQMSFPSKGKPTITIAFTRSSGTKSYSYTFNEELPANHKINIEGTYSQSQGVELTGIITGSEWGENKDITFDFDETNTTEENNPTPTGLPEAGDTYQDHYVVAVNGNVVTVLSNKQQRNLGITESTSNPVTTINSIVEGWAAEEGVSGTWRVPTDAEARIFLVDPNSFEPRYAGNTCSYFCIDGNTLKGIILRKNNDDTRTIDGYESVLSDMIWLRPVMDITVQ